MSGCAPLIQKEMNTIWSWYVQSYAGQLAVVLFLVVFAGFITMIINPIIKRIATTNISSDTSWERNSRGSSDQKGAAEVLVGHDEVNPHRVGVQGELDDEAPPKEGTRLSCCVASRPSQTAITKNQENAKRARRSAAARQLQCTHSLRKDDGLHR